MFELIIVFLLGFTSSRIEGTPLLLFANRKDIRIIDAQDPRGNMSIVEPNLGDAVAVDFLYSDRMIVWTDLDLPAIKRAYLDDQTNTSTIIGTDLQTSDGLACDWIGRNLYWTDSGTYQIKVSNLDGTFRKVLVWEGLDKPRAIALDPLQRYMFWTDWGTEAKIERAGMDGSNRMTIVHKDIFWPNGLTLDLEASTVYWCDAKLYYIHRCDYDGSNRQQVISEMLQHPFALSLDDNTLYWTDWKTKSINKCNKMTGEQRGIVLDQIYSPADIRVFSPNRQPNARSPCGNNNGGCSHLCLLSPVEPFYSCACPTGIKLQDDNKNCGSLQKFLVLARRTDLRRISLETPDYTDLTIPVKNIKHALAIDYDPVDGFVYWTDDEVRSITRAKLDGTDEKVLINTELANPDGLAVDWVNRNFYWTDTGLDRIEVARLNGTDRQILISENLDEPRAIVLDLNDGYMYWTDWGKNARIERARLDGSERQVLISTDLAWPNGHALDLSTRQIYWGDAKLDRIEKASLDGKNRTVLVDKNVPHVFGLSLLGDYVYWSDWQMRSVQRVNKHTGEDRVTLRDSLPNLMGLKAVDTNAVNYPGMTEISSEKSDTTELPSTDPGMTESCSEKCDITEEPSTGLIVGISVCVLLVFIVIFIVVTVCIIRKRTSRSKEEDNERNVSLQSKETYPSVSDTGDVSVMKSLPATQEKTDS